MKLRVFAAYFAMSLALGGMFWAGMIAERRRASEADEWKAETHIHGFPVFRNTRTGERKLHTNDWVSLGKP